LDALTRVDYVNRFALVARSGGRGVALARYAALPPSADGSLVADIAVAVSISWRRVSLATKLVQLLVRRAEECGITDIAALFLADNRPVTELAHGEHARVVIAEGVAQLCASLKTTRQAEPSGGGCEEQYQ